jgi:hypothetical protein
MSSPASLSSLLPHASLRDALAGAAGALCLVLAGLPFDVVKLRMQLGAASAAGAAAPTPPTRNPLRLLATIAAREGPRALWRGFSPALGSAMVENVVLFTAFGALKRLVAPSAAEEADLSLAQHALIGGVSGCFSATAICPAELLKCRLQAEAAAAASVSASASASASAPARSVGGVAGGSSRLAALACARTVWRNGGARGFFAGLAPLLARDIPFNTLFFGSFRLYSRALREPLPGVAGTLLAGGLAGSTAWTVVYPADVVKSRMQSDIGGSGGGGVRGAARVLAGILRQGGLPLLYRGWSAAVLRAFPANAALFFGVTSVESLLDAVR